MDHSISTNAIRSTIRLSSNIEKLVYIGSPPTVLAFLENGHIAAYEETSSGLHLSHQRAILGADRSVVLAHGALFGNLALFCKADSPSVWCLPIRAGERLPDPFKLRSDIEGDQENVNFFDGTVAKIRGKVTAKQTSRVSPVLALASHPALPLVAAAYRNGIIRVWDVNRKEQRSHFDVQLLLSEAIVAIAFHPSHPVVVACTTHGRIISFVIKQTAFKRTEEPDLATSKTRVRKRRFRAMCFSHSNPSYLLLLTASRRIITRVVNRAGVLLLSSRFPKSSRPLALRDGAILTSEFISQFDDFEDESTVGGDIASLTFDPVFGLMACSLDNSGNVYIFQRMVDGFPSLRSPVSTGLDLPLSDVEGQKFTGPVNVNAESLVVFDNTLFVYTLGTESFKKICRLPAGDIRSVKTARDECGYCVGALIFYYGDDAIDSTEYSDPKEPAQFVICTKLKSGDDWNVSEPSEGRSGCFLNLDGKHDRLMVVSESGQTVSLSPFACISAITGQAPRPSSGVQRFKLENGRATNVFRAPFASWLSVLYHDTMGKRVSVSKNAFDGYNASKDLSQLYDMDAQTAMALQGNETVLDIRWQRLPGGSPSKDEYLGAIMTEQRIYFVRHVLQPISQFEFNSISRIVVPFAAPSLTWVGQSVMLLFGNSLFSISVDGHSDLVAGLSNGEYATCIVATLADRLLYAAPNFSGKTGSVCVRSRPFGGVSGSLRGMLSLVRSGRGDAQQNGTLVSKIMEQHDVSQGSSGLVNCLASKQMSAMSYMIVMSPSGKFVMSSVRRALFLARMGDIRGALTVAEDEYARLPSGREFHHGTELFRLVQRILNIAFIIGDYETCGRCSTLLGRRGTVLAFIEGEGGLEALQSVMDQARSSGDNMLLGKLKLLVDRSAKSSVASEIGAVPSRREVYAIREAIASMQGGTITLGSTDRRDMFIFVVSEPAEEGKTTSAASINSVKLALAGVNTINERLEMLRCSAKAYSADASSGGDNMDYDTFVDEGDDGRAHQTSAPPLGSEVDKRVADSSEEDIADGKGGEYAGQFSKHRKDEHVHNQSARPIAGMLPVASGQLTHMTMEGVIDTERKLEQHTVLSKAGVGQAAESMHELANAQRLLRQTGNADPEVKANDLLLRACEKLRENRHESAQKDIENAIRAIARGVERGVPVTASLLTPFIHYRFACRLRDAMVAIAESEHATQMAGLKTYLQLSTMETNLMLKNVDRIDALVRTGDANMRLGNFGTASQALRLIKDIGVPENIREKLRQRFAVCQSHQFVDAVQMPPQNICYRSLKAIAVGIRTFGCSVCVAVFAGDSGVVIGTACEYCRMGQIIMR